MRRRPSFVAVALIAVVSITAAMLTACARDARTPEAGVNAGPDGTPAAYREPVKLSSKDGVLEVRLSAHQGVVNLDTVKEPVTNFLVYGYQLLKGTSSDGSTKGDNIYPAPTLRVEPGERLIIHYDNDLQELTIDDFNDPAYVAAGQDVPLYPPPLRSAPLNLHTHGLHVSPSGNADNVLLSIPAGMGNRYDYAVPTDMPHGLYWYHSHRHTVTAPQTYMGLAGMLEIGRPDGNLPLVTDNDIPIRTMALQYNFVFDRKNGGHQLNNPYWEQWVSTLKPPQGTQLADGTYRPSLAPVNFSQSSDGAEYFTNWYAGPLSTQNHRGQNQFIPQNLQTFTSPSRTIPADPALPDNQRDVQFTVNGQFQPRLEVRPGQTEIWVFANMSDIAYMPIRLTETATGDHPKFSIVGQDGNPYTQVQRPVDGDGTYLEIPPGSRYAIAVTMPESGDLVIDMPPKPGVKGISEPAVLYTNNGTEDSPAVLGTVTIKPEHIAARDGFFTFPTQTLLTAGPAGDRGRAVAFEPGQNLGAYTSFVDTSVMTPDVTRALDVGGGFGNKKANNSDSKAFTYQFDDNIFPNIPLIQPRLNSVEEWSITNYNNDGHPMHIHVNDFQVQQVVSPLIPSTTGVQPWGLDNANVPPPVVDANDDPLVPSSLTLRSAFSGYVGTFVIHCHRLNHEDNGLMATVNVIPEVSTYAVAIPGSKGKPATVQVRDGADDQVIAVVTPFPAFEGTPSVAMADVNGDMILDLIAGTGEGVEPEVVAFSGDVTPAATLTSELVRFAPFDAGFRGGVRVAGADIDGNALADNIIVGTGPGIESQVKVFASTLPDAKGAAPEVFSSFQPYPGSKSGVTLATGLVEMGSGRQSIVTAPGPGDAARIKTFHYDLFSPTARMQARQTTHEHDGYPGAPVQTSEFLAYDEAYTDGVSLSAGWVAGEEGGAMSIVTGQLRGDGTVRTWSSGSRLDGFPGMYVQSPNHHDVDVKFARTSSFAPFDGAPGVTVATTSTTAGADLVVSGAVPGGVEVRKYVLGRPRPDATTLAPKPLATLPRLASVSGAVPLAGR
nr:multicopper oxidase domain-containing protein [Mycolicibacterium komanii]CRL69125.1 putative multicopper oxidase [Mycolicibacterium komanii]